MTVEEVLMAEVESLKATMVRREASIRRVESNHRLVQRALDLASEATLDVLKAFDDGIFIRHVEGDGAPGWAMKLLTPIKALATLKGIAEENEFVG